MSKFRRTAFSEDDLFSTHRRIPGQINIKWEASHRSKRAEAGGEILVFRCYYSPAMDSNEISFRENNAATTQKRIGRTARL